MTGPAFALALAGEIMAWAGLPGPGVLLATLGLLALVRSRPGPPPPVPGRGTERAVLAALVLAGAWLRGHRLADLPPGIWLDEGRTGFWAVRIMRGEALWGMPEASEPLGYWLDALAFRLFGPTLTTGRAVSALLGTATIPALWWALRSVYGPAVALGAAGALAVSRWHIYHSRLATVYVLLPLAVALASGCLVRAVATGRTRWWIGLGLTAAAAVNAYLPGRALPAVLAATAALSLLRPVAGARPGGRGWALAGGAFAVAMLPFAIHLATFPVALSFRLGQLTEGFRLSPVRTGLLQAAHGLAAPWSRTLTDLITTFPAAADAPFLAAPASALALLGLPFLAHARWPAWNTFLLLLGLSQAAICAVTGLGGFRLAAVIPLLCLLQGLTLARLAAVRPVLAVAVLGMVAVTEAHGVVTDRWWGAPRVEMERTFFARYRDLADALAVEARRHPLALSPDSAEPDAATEISVAPVIFLAGPVLRHRVPATLAEGTRDGGEVAFLVGSRRKLELLREVVPGGRMLEIAERGSPTRGGGAYLAGRTARARMPLRDLADLIRELDAQAALAAAGRPGEALAAADGLVARWPAVGECRVRRGGLLLQAGRRIEAAREIALAVRLCGRVNAQALQLRGSLAAADGAIDEARGWWRRSLVLDPAQEGVWANLILACTRLGDTESARITLREALSRFPDSLALRGLAL